MDTKILEDIGLTKGEIKVYMALLETGQTTAGTILRKTGVQNSVLHFNINRLIQKGLISYIKKGKVRVYKAADPNNFITYLKEKEKQIKIILPELKSKQTVSKNKQETEMFEGIKGVITALNKFIEPVKRGDEFLFFSADLEESNEEIQKFYKRWDLRRKEKGIVTKGIAPKKLKHLFDGRRELKMKYSDMPIPANSGVCNDKLIFVSWSEKPVAVLIQSKELAYKQRIFFNSYWERL